MKPMNNSNELMSLQYYFVIYVLFYLIDNIYE